MQWQVKKIFTKIFFQNKCYKFAEISHGSVDFVPRLAGDCAEIFVFAKLTTNENVRKAVSAVWNITHAHKFMTCVINRSTSFLAQSK